MIPRRRPAAPLRRLDSRVSRRGLLGAGVLAGVLAASGVPLQARSRGGVLRIGLNFPRIDGRGAGWEGAPAVIAQGAVYDTLVEIGPTGELRGELARSWEASADARVWHFALRSDAAFHDGRPLRASDVAASLLRHRRGRTAWALSGVEAIEPLGPSALRLTLAEPDTDLPFLLAEPRLVVGPDGRFDGIGTGLYRLGERQVPGTLRLERVASHWRDGQAGWFDAIEAVHLPQARDRLDAILADRVDAIGPLPPAQTAAAREAGVAVTAVRGNRQLHARLPPGATRRQRRLLPFAIDRAAVAAEWGGVPAADQPLGPLHPAFVALPPSELDPAAAAELAEADVRYAGWDPCATEEATFRKALSEGPWAPIRRHPALLRALDAARRSQGAERDLHYAAAQSIVARTGFVTVAAHVPTVTLHSPRLAHGGAVSALSTLDGGRLAERWWFA